MILAEAVFLSASGLLELASHAGEIERYEALRLPLVMVALVLLVRQCGEVCCEREEGWAGWFLRGVGRGCERGQGVENPSAPVGHPARAPIAAPSSVARLLALVV